MNATMRKWTTSKTSAIDWPSMAQRFPKLTPEDEPPRSGGGRGHHRRPARRGARALHRLAAGRLAGHVQRLGEYLRWKGKLLARLKELAVLVIGAALGHLQHEWVMHSQARPAGRPRRGDDRRHPQRPRAEEGILDEEKWVYNFCKQAHAGRVNDEAFAYIQGHFGLDGALGTTRAK